MRKVAGWRERRGIPSHRRILLHQEDNDGELERLFPATLRPEFFTAVEGIGNVVLTSPGYSVYDDHSMCEVLQLINLKRSIQFVYLANRAGLPCIPCIGWHKDRVMDLQRLSDWLVRQGDKITHLAVNAQTGSTEQWRQLTHGMAYLESATIRQYRWVVFGGTDVLRVIFGCFDTTRIIQVSATVTSYTSRHRLLGQSTPTDLALNDLLVQNLAIEAERRSKAITMCENARSRATVI